MFKKKILHNSGKYSTTNVPHLLGRSEAGSGRVPEAGPTHECTNPEKKDLDEKRLRPNGVKNKRQLRVVLHNRCASIVGPL